MSKQDCTRLFIRGPKSHRQTSQQGMEALHCMWVQRGVEGLQGGRDPITAVAAAPHMLLIGRTSGEVLVYTLPDLVPAGNAMLPCLWSPSLPKQPALRICF